MRDPDLRAPQRGVALERRAVVRDCGRRLPASSTSPRPSSVAGQVVPFTVVTRGDALVARGLAPFARAGGAGTWAISRSDRSPRGRDRPHAVGQPTGDGDALACVMVISAVGMRRPRRAEGITDPALDVRFAVVLLSK